MGAQTFPEAEGWQAAAQTAAENQLSAPGSWPFKPASKSLSLCLIRSHLLYLVGWPGCQCALGGGKRPLSGFTRRHPPGELGGTRELIQRGVQSYRTNLSSDLKRLTCAHFIFSSEAGASL